jgi:predicted nucleic acid-binding protein
MTPVFLDTVGLIALWERADQWHVDAEREFQLLIAAAVPLFTTPQVLLECGNTAARRPYREQVAQLRDDLARANALIAVTAAEEELAWKAFRRGEAGQAGIVDHLSFVIMRRLKLTQAFTNDRHFVAAGFEVLF